MDERESSLTELQRPKNSVPLRSRVFPKQVNESIIDSESSEEEVLSFSLRKSRSDSY